MSKGTFYSIPGVRGQWVEVHIKDDVVTIKTNFLADVESETSFKVTDKQIDDFLRVFENIKTNHEIR